MLLGMRGVVLVGMFSISGLSGLFGCAGGPSLTIEINGDGMGWVEVDVEDGSTTSWSCTQSCEVELPTPAATVKIRVGTTQQLTSSSCPESPRHCELAVSDGQELTFKFEKDPHELITMFLDEAPRAIAFAANSDLIIATDTSLRRVALDGTEAWRVPRESKAIDVRASASASASGLIAVANDEQEIAVYHEDGTFAWQLGVQYLCGLAIGANDDVIVKNGFGMVIAMSGADGSERWRRLLPFPKDGTPGVVTDRSGMVVARTYDPQRLMRFDASGAPLSPLVPPTPLAEIEFGPDDQLVGTNSGGYVALVPVVYTRFDAAGTASSFISGPAFQHGFGLHEDGIFEWRQAMAPTLVATTLTISSLDQNGAVNWQVVKGEVEPDGVSTLDRITEVSSACDRDGHHCAIIGHYARRPVDGQLDMQHWLAVYTP